MKDCFCSLCVVTSMNLWSGSIFGKGLCCRIAFQGFVKRALRGRANRLARTYQVRQMCLVDKCGLIVVASFLSTVSVCYLAANCMLIRCVK